METELESEKTDTNQPALLKSEIPPPDTRSWYEHTWKKEQQTPDRIEDAAKFLAAMITVSLSIFLAVGKESIVAAQNSGLVKTASILWLLSLFSSFFVLFPWRYRYASDSVQSIKNMHKRVVRCKRLLLILSLLLLSAALTLLSWVFFY